MSAGQAGLVRRLAVRSRRRRMLGYLGLLARHATPERLRNLALNEWEFRRGRERLVSLPPQLTLDVTNYCNLRCPLCATGARQHPGPALNIDPAAARRILERFARKSFHVFLYCWGEPLLHPGLAGIVAATKRLNLAVTLSTNLQVPLDKRRALELVAAGPDVIVVSIDGLTQQSYGRYRQGGSLQTALDNLAALAAARRELGRRLPVLEWQTLLFAHNLHEVPAILGRYRELGADRISFESPNLLFGAATSSDAADWLVDAGDGAGHDIKDNVAGACWWPYRSAIVAPDGTVSPCCYVYGPQAQWGSMLERDFAEIWNSERFRQLRRAFSKPGSAAPPPCNRCSVPRRFVEINPR